MKGRTSSSSAGVHVFLDQGGRRRVWARLAGRAVALLSALYLGVLGASLVGASWVPRLALPALGPVMPVRAPATGLTLPPTAAIGPALPQSTKKASAAPTTTTSIAQPPPTTTKPNPAPATTKATAAATTTTALHHTPATTRPTTSTTVAPGRSGTSPGHQLH